MEFSLVFESVSERRILMDIAPHLVNPLGFLFPVYKGSRRSLWQINAGMWLYDGLSLFRSPKLHRKLNAREIEKEEPALKTANIAGAPLYYDCSTDDARLTLESALDAVQCGAIVSTYSKMESFLYDESGRITGAKVVDTLNGREKEIRAHVVINATGPWTDDTIAVSRDKMRKLLRPTKGIHIVVDASVLPVNNAVVCFHPSDGRVLFAIPWGEQTYIGTTDTDFEGDPAEIHATNEDVHYLVDAANVYFPEVNLKPEHVIATWAGLRPLMSPVTETNDVDESSVSREHQILVGKDGLITIAGGKLTTYRKMSEEVVDTAVKLLRISGYCRDRRLARCQTEQEPLPGAVGWPSDDNHGRVRDWVLEVTGDLITDRTAKLLANQYGMKSLDIARHIRENPELARPIIEGRPEVYAQVDWAIREELARTISDILVRRTQIFYRDGHQGLNCLEALSKYMAERLNWDDERRMEDIQAYKKRVSLSCRWREEEGIQDSE
jgi:glycerol-3-phosphate dehydrogenase